MESSPPGVRQEHNEKFNCVCHTRNESSGSFEISLLRLSQDKKSSKTSNVEAGPMSEADISIRLASGVKKRVGNWLDTLTSGPIAISGERPGDESEEILLRVSHMKEAQTICQGKGKAVWILIMRWTKAMGRDVRLRDDDDKNHRGIGGGETEAELERAEKRQMTYPDRTC
ncbi:hypothetical protein PPACK8108_LOCUS20214 [Phakopsora pachyrhizi]|uniref:Uncharacterized protein n=1 Tax=Phakopsora pachyrhizi TaxID=170000 RepID=A0AAV0BEI6_PHAPC|nr:hypothetical protein PPACK8108_LOCUS20214 [Phakopsora pachyrhizi]